MVKLHDKIADKDVTVASLHWATAQGEGPILPAPSRTCSRPTRSCTRRRTSATS
ncbi:hypothetical protein [Nannocystis pusilla]|uniref:hypothetical protein n=1 Tax=Nannocystis pusilla TaxID=889268 RepID=UPI003B7C8BAE